MKTALVCIAKNEDNYIHEWLSYYRKLGVDKVFVYQNDWEFELDYDFVVNIPFHGKVRQTEAYNHFIKNFREQFDWALFFDCDEFLVLKKHNDIKHFLEYYKDFNGVGINWVLYGDNGLQESDDYSCLTRFTKRQNGVNRHIKTILNLNKSPNIRMIIHNPNTDIVDPKKRPILGPFNPKGDDEIAQINHYFSKTLGEFRKKVDRGRADYIHKRDMKEFFTHNFNDIEDKSALDFFNK